jgi:hypothetical protein
MRRTAVVLVTVGALVALPATFAPAQADPDFSGFSSSATAAPLKIEIYEPAIPIPAEPQLEFELSYTRVNGSSGPNGSARASAFWPGDSIGEGFKTVGEQFGLPDALTKDGYPMQVNAQFPGDVSQAAQEPLPGTVTRVNATDKKATAKVGYGTGGDVPEGDPGAPATTTPTPAPTNPLTALLGGDLSALGSILTGTTTGSAENPVSTSPLGTLGLLVNASGMQSISTTDYSGDKVVATATSRLGELSLLAGLVKLTGVEVVARTTSNLAEGAKTSSKVTFGGMTIAGIPYALTGNGVQAGGQTTPIPGLPAAATDALKALGIAIEMPQPTVVQDGAHGAVAAQGVRITIDTGPLRSKLPALPLADLINKLPDQAGQIKGLLLAMTEAHPKLVVSLGAVTSEVTTVAAIAEDASASAPDTTTTTSSGTTAGTSSPGTTAPAIGSPGEVAPAALAPVTTTPVKQVAAVPGLPPLGSVPGMLALLGLLLAAGAGWYLRRAGVLLFGAGGTCNHGLKAGVPDLRKA